MLLLITANIWAMINHEVKQCCISPTSLATNILFHCLFCKMIVINSPNLSRIRSLFIRSNIICRQHHPFLFVILLFQIRVHGQCVQSGGGEIWDCVSEGGAGVRLHLQHGVGQPGHQHQAVQRPGRCWHQEKQIWPVSNNSYDQSLILKILGLSFSLSKWSKFELF